MMGAAIADLPVDAQPPEGVEIVEADRGPLARRGGGVEPVRGRGGALGGPARRRRGRDRACVALRDGEPVGIAGAIAVGETLYLQYLVGARDASAAAASGAR